MHHLMTMSALVCWTLTGCELANPPAPPPALDFATFTCIVEPVLAAECSFPACHGSPDRPFKTLSPGRMRLSDEYVIARELLTAEQVEDGIHPPLTEAEQRFNYAQARSFATEPASDSALLSRPLAMAAGGRFHAPNADVFTSTESDGYRAIERWLLGQEGSCP